MRTGTRLVGELEPVQRQIEEWRTTRWQRERMPEELWQAAAQLARTHGVNSIARAFHLDYYRLKGRVQSKRHKSAAKAGSPAFVEVRLPPAGQAMECTVQLEDRHGARMNLRLVGGGAAEVAALTQSFWRRQP